MKRTSSMGSRVAPDVIKIFIQPSLNVSVWLRKPDRPLEDGRLRHLHRQELHDQVLKRLCPTLEASTLIFELPDASTFVNSLLGRQERVSSSRKLKTECPRHQMRVH